MTGAVESTMPCGTLSSNGAGTGGWHVRVAGIGRHLPPRIMSNEEVERRGGFAVGSIDRSRAGVRERRRAAADVSAVEMAAIACSEALHSAGLRAVDVDLVINASAGCAQQIPDGGALLHKALGLGSGALPAWSVHATCISFLVGRSHGRPLAAPAGGPSLASACDLATISQLLLEARVCPLPSRSRLLSASVMWSRWPLRWRLLSCIGPTAGIPPSSSRRARSPRQLSTPWTHTPLPSSAMEPLL